jgi:flavin-dependent dehydrogenase
MRLLSLLTVCIVSQTCLSAEYVNESARDIPVAYDVDVAIVGGGTGAVAAAVAAAEEGANVFLAAPRPYLGDDMTETLRLWLEEGEEPTTDLARRIFDDRGTIRIGGRHPNAIDFNYEADIPSSGVHKDSEVPSLLKDGNWGSASANSVQYDGDVNITIDLGKPQLVDEVRIVAFHRNNGEDRETQFKVKQASVFVSDDKTTWKPIGRIENKDVKGETARTLKVPTVTTTRFLKVLVEKTDDVDRILLGEIEVIGAGEKVVENPNARPMPRPMHIKRTLDDALLEAGVKFLYACHVTDVLKDDEGRVSGFVMANRAGRQAVKAKVVIDATHRGTAARLAGVEFRPYPTGDQTFKRTVVGGEPVEGKNMTHRVIDPPFGSSLSGGGRAFKVIEYTLTLPMKDASWRSWAAADQKARGMTYTPEQQFTSDRLFQVPPDSMIGAASSTARDFNAPDQPPLSVFEPKGIAGLYVLGGCADVSREAATLLLRPNTLMTIGQRIGERAASDAKSRSVGQGVRVAVGETDSPASVADEDAEIKEFLSGVRATQMLPTVAQNARGLPVFGKYDVIVIGGGTAGAPAAISSGRKGAKTLLVEYQCALGGVGTAGLITKYYWGNRVGFTATVPGGGSWIPEQKIEWYRSEAIKAGAEIWYSTIGCGAVVDGNEVIGAVISTPFGRGVVLGKVVIDATGNSDVAAAAGAPTIYTDDTEFGMQGTGLPPRNLGATYTNTDFTIVDETDMLDVWHVYVFAKQKYASAFDQSPFIDTRERRRIVGDFTIDLRDQLLRRTHADTIVRAYSNFDTHGYTIDPLLEISHPEKKGIYVDVPYRCSLPKGWEGILVGGLGVSSHRDAIPLIRMQPDIQNQGYALGYIAATVAETDSVLRHIDIREVQRHLVEIGNLPEAVTTQTDNFPLSGDTVAAAVMKLGENPEDTLSAAVILAHLDVALPLLEKAYTAATASEVKLAYAQMLAITGNNAGVETLIEEVDRHAEWGPGWNYRGMGQFGNALSPLDTLIVALGRTGDKRALPTILKKTAQLDADQPFSHHRAAALALELIGDASAAEPLAGVLAKPGMSGHVHTTVEIAKAVDKAATGGTNTETSRRLSLRELLLARALYRCGDHEELGKKTLEAYANDLRGHLSRHAKAVLKGRK